jgi:hypothetical protein
MSFSALRSRKSKSENFISCLGVARFFLLRLSSIPVPSAWGLLARGTSTPSLFAQTVRNSSTTNMASMSRTLSPSVDLNSLQQWTDLPKDVVTRIIPRLTPEAHKGSYGRIGILGGSEQYTGAPFYAAMSALNTGSDLAFVFCAQEAAIPLKGYSPELMVSPVYEAKAFSHALELEGDAGEQEQNRYVTNSQCMPMKWCLPY